MTDLRDQIARALLDVPSAFALDDYPLLSARIPADVEEAYVLADAVLAVLDLDKIRAEAVHESKRYIERITPKGLVDRADVLADLEIAAGRLARGIHANGLDRKEKSSG